MKKILTTTILLMILTAFSAGATEFQKESERSTELDGAAIDLLVGTPAGVVEPLDERRSRPDTSQNFDFSEFLNYDSDSEENSEADLSWQDAEETQFSGENEDSSINDLLTEIEDFESQEKEKSAEDFDDNISDCVETELKL